MVWLYISLTFYYQCNIEFHLWEILFSGGIGHPGGKAVDSSKTASVLAVSEFFFSLFDFFERGRNSFISPEKVDFPICKTDLLEYFIRDKFYLVERELSSKRKFVKSK